MLNFTDRIILPNEVSILTSVKNNNKSMDTSFNDSSNDRSARLMKRKGGDLYSQQWKVQKKSRSFLVGSLSPFNYYPQPKTNFELVNQALDQYCGSGIK
jgi:hypothetical protein